MTLIDSEDLKAWIKLEIGYQRSRYFICSNEHGKEIISAEIASLVIFKEKIAELEQKQANKKLEELEGE